MILANVIKNYLHEQLQFLRIFSFFICRDDISITMTNVIILLILPFQTPFIFPYALYITHPPSRLICVHFLKYNHLEIFFENNVGTSAVVILPRSSILDVRVNFISLLV